MEVVDQGDAFQDEEVAAVFLDRSAEAGGYAAGSHGHSKGLPRARAGESRLGV